MSTTEVQNNNCPSDYGPWLHQSGMDTCHRLSPHPATQEGKGEEMGLKLQGKEKSAGLKRAVSPPQPF